MRTSKLQATAQNSHNMIFRRWIKLSALILAAGLGITGMSSGALAACSVSTVISTQQTQEFVADNTVCDVTITNTGSFTGNMFAAIVFFGNTTSTSLNNAGNIGGPIGVFVTNSTLPVINNSGTISSNTYGILNSYSLITTINNTGTISSLSGIANNGTIATLNNSQGGGSNASLTYSGALPTAYNALVRSLSNFGQLAVSNGTGTMTFGVDNTSVLTANLYTNVLTGVPAANITNAEEETEVPLGNFVWKLTASSTANSWDLLVWRNATSATEFSDKSDAILQTVTDNELRGLTSALSANQAMLRDAKGRFVAGADQDVAMNVDGSLTANPVSLSSMGTFFGQSTNGNGTRQLVFGNFDVQRDDATGASTATFNGKIAWERSVSNTTMLGYFIGADLARSNIAGSFTGDQDHLGITAGGYAVHEMAKQLYLDGFVSVGAGRNNLTMDDGVLALGSDYTTRSATFGMSVSGVIGPEGYEIWPELALTVGRTWIDTVAFTGTAYDATDNTLSLAAGMVTLANLTFRPEFRVPLDGSEVAKSLRLFTLAPRLICQQTTTTTTAQTCGGGAELGLKTHSADGTATASAQILSDWIDGQTRTSGQLSVEMRF